MQQCDIEAQRGEKAIAAMRAVELRGQRALSARPAAGA